MIIRRPEGRWRCVLFIVLDIVNGSRTRGMNSEGVKLSKRCLKLRPTTGITVLCWSNGTVAAKSLRDIKRGSSQSLSNIGVRFVRYLYRFFYSADTISAKIPTKQQRISISVSVTHSNM